MIHLQCTQSVLKHLGIDPKELQQADDTNAVLGNWSVTSMVIDRRNAFLFMSDRSLLSFLLLEGKLAFDLTRLQGLLHGGVSQLLDFLGVGQKTIDLVLLEMNTIAVARTKDRGLLGNLSSLADDYQHRVMASGGLNSCDLTEIIMSINGGPQRRLGWSSSVEITKQLLGSTNGAA